MAHNNGLETHCTLTSHFFYPLSGYWYDISCPWCPTVCYCLSTSQACSIRKKLSRTFLNITGQSGVWKICRISIPSTSVLRRLREGLEGAQNNCFLMEQGLTNQGGGTGQRCCLNTLDMVGCFPAEDISAHAPRCALMFTSFFRAGEAPSRSHASASSQPRWDLHSIQPRLKTPLFWCSESRGNAPQPRRLAACISGEHLALSCFPRPGFSLPQPADTHQLLPNLALFLPSSLQGLTFLPHTGGRGRGVGTLAAHPALGLLDLLSPHRPAPNRCQNSTAAPSVL